VVITSSAVAVIPWKKFALEESDEVFDEKTAAAIPSGPFQSEFEAYAASKVHALQASNKFIEEKKPRFDVINILPTFVFGRNELVTDAKDITTGTNGILFGPVLGNKAEIPLPGTSVHVNDVAWLHVQALDPKIPGNQNFPANSHGLEGVVYDDALRIVAQHYPDAVAKGLLPINGTQPTKKVKFDASRTEETFGMKFESFEEQLRSLTDQYIKLKASA